MDQDNEVVRRVIGGDVESFRFLVKKYERRVLAMVSNVLQDVHSPEDVAQDVFFTAYRRLGSFDPGRGRFSTWLLTIARHKCLNALKKKAAKAVDSLPETASVRTPHDELTRKELFERLDRELDALPPGQKTAFVLAQLVGLSHEEISQIQGVRIGTVRSRISRARRRLRSSLGQADGGGT